MNAQQVCLRTCLKRAVWWQRSVVGIWASCPTPTKGVGKHPWVTSLSHFLCNCVHTAPFSELPQAREITAYMNLAPDLVGRPNKGRFLKDSDMHTSTDLHFTQSLLLCEWKCSQTNPSFPMFSWSPQILESNEPCEKIQVKVSNNSFLWSVNTATEQLKVSCQWIKAQI